MNANMNKEAMNNTMTVEEIQRKMITDMQLIIDGYDNDDRAGFVPVQATDDTTTVAPAADDGVKTNTTDCIEILETDVSSLDTTMTSSTSRLWKDAYFTEFTNRNTFRYAKYWVKERDAPAHSELAKYYGNQWWEGYVRREKHACGVDTISFKEWWVRNEKLIQQRISLKRTNLVSQLRKVFKGIWC